MRASVLYKPNSSPVRALRIYYTSAVLFSETDPSVDENIAGQTENTSGESDRSTADRPTNLSSDSDLPQSPQYLYTALNNDPISD